MRRSRQAAAQSRQVIIEEAARLFRERGIAAVSVADVMAAAGMTHGGFYAHFASKADLAAAAATKAFDDKLAQLEPHAMALPAYVDSYLSPQHVTDLAHGCPIAGLGVDALRSDPELRAAVSAGARRTIATLADRLGAQPADRTRAIRLMAQMLGGIMLARILDDTAERTDVLSAIRAGEPARSLLATTPD